MSKIKALSGEEVIKILLKFGFEKVSQKGSHVKLVRKKEHSKEIIIIPLHSELDKGTLKAIYRKVIHYIPEELIKNTSLRINVYG